jgi:hypothetical protein
MASPAPALTPVGRARTGGGSRTPLRSPLGRTELNDDVAEKAAAAQSRAANELRRRCAPPACAPRVPAAARGGGTRTARAGLVERASALARAPLARSRGARRSLDSGAENEAPNAAPAASKAGEPARAKAAALSTAQVLDLYSNWCALLALRLRAPKRLRGGRCTNRLRARALAIGCPLCAWSGAPCVGCRPDAAAAGALRARAASSWRPRTRLTPRTRGRWR